MNRQKLGMLTALLTCIVGVTAFAHADNTEGGNNKLVSTISVASDTSVILTVQSPSATLASACLFGTMQISADNPAKTLWMSQLLTAKASQIPITISYTPSSGTYLTSCPITSVGVGP